MHRSAPGAAFFRFLRIAVAVLSVAGLLLGIAGALFAIGMGGFGGGRTRALAVVGLFAPVPQFAAAFLSMVYARRRGVLILLAAIVVLASIRVLRVALGGPDLSGAKLLVGFLIAWSCALVHRLLYPPEPTA